MSIEPHDQTRGDSTPYIDGARKAALSRNEVAALCMKAARGAGMSWGLAEKAGFAAAWLVQHGFDGPEHLHVHQEQAQGRNWTDLCPTITPGEWRAPAGRTLCPIALGATLCDHDALPEGLIVGRPIRIDPVGHPVLLIPFLAAIAESAEILIDLEWDDGSDCIGGDPAALAGAASALGDAVTGLSLTARTGAVRAAAAAQAPITAGGTIAALNILAMRTTVPPSEASRAGAGSATSDNDRNLKGRPYDPRTPEPRSPHEPGRPYRRHRFSGRTGPRRSRSRH